MSSGPANERAKTITENLVGSWHLVDWEDGDRAHRGNAYRAALIDEIISMGEPAAGPLAAWLDDERVSAFVKVKIIQLLGAVGSQETIERLVRVLAQDDLPELDLGAVAAVKQILERHGRGRALSVLRAWYGAYDFAYLRDDPLELEIFKGVVGAKMTESRLQRLSVLAERKQVSQDEILKAWLVYRHASDSLELLRAYPHLVKLSSAEVDYLASNNPGQPADTAAE